LSTVILTGIFTIYQVILSLSSLIWWKRMQSWRVE